MSNGNVVPSVVPDNGGFWSVSKISQITVAGLLFLAIASGAGGYWVFGSTYKSMVGERDKMVIERDEWKNMALEGLKAAKTVSSARLPILDSKPEQELTLDDVHDQLTAVKRLNNK